MKNILPLAGTAILCLILLFSCASAPQAVYIHSHLHELWGKTQAEIIKLIPEEYLASADIRISRIVIKQAFNLDYGYGVAIPAISQIITYLFYDSHLFRVSIETSTNEFTATRQKQKLYADFEKLNAEYNALLGAPDVIKDQAIAPDPKAVEKIICGSMATTWEAKAERGSYPFLAVVLEYSCFEKPVVMVRLRETYTDNRYNQEKK